MVHLEEDEPSWTPITFDDEGYLNFQGLFWNEEVVNHASSSAEVEIRLKPGNGYSLEALSRNTNYLVEVRGAQGTYFLNFF